MENVFPAVFNCTKVLVDDLEMQIELLPSGRESYVAIRPEDIVIKNKIFWK